MRIASIKSRPRLSVPRQPAAAIPSLPTLDDRTFSQLAKLIENELGLKMPSSKRAMIASRLARRLRQLGCSDYGDYLEHLRSDDARALEYAAFVDAVTTHTTHFFREAQHFDLLTRVVLPELVRHRGSKPLRIWSAGCSTGEEVYTLSMVVHDYLNRVARGTDYQILGTDISRQALQHAATAVYSLDSIGSIPEHFRQTYLLRSRDAEAARVRIVPELRSRVRFAELNLVSATWALSEPLDLIFCRNVLIYFERPVQQRIVKRLSAALASRGFLILGHSEGLTGNLPHLRAHGRSVYEQHLAQQQSTSGERPQRNREKRA